MSRIGNQPITIPQAVKVELKDNSVLVEGPKGKLSQELKPEVSIEVEDGKVVIARKNDQKKSKAMHGLYRSLIFNMVEGVSEGYKKNLELVGVGYKATVQGNLMELNLGYSHSIFFALPPEIKATAVTEKGKNPIVTLESHDKQLIGHIAAKLRSLRPVEPYKGKGIRFIGERIRRKAGKTAAK